MWSYWKGEDLPKWHSKKRTSSSLRGGRMKKVWMVCKSTGGKYFDGFYGMDSSIHSSEQIFDQDNIPYEIDSYFRNIVVGVGREKPNPARVMAILNHQDATERLRKTASEFASTKEA